MTARRGLRFAALGYLALLLILPVGLVVYRTFEPGIGAVWNSITTPAAISAFWLTLEIAALAVAINTVMGVITALLLVRGRVRGKWIIEALLDLPFAISPVVVGLSLVLVYGRGGWLDGLPFQVIFSLPGMVLATIFVTLPFVVREVVPTLREVGTEQEQAAETLGASGWQTFWRITLPCIRWAVIYGVVLTAARGIGEFGAVAVVSGNFAGETQTATLRVEDAYQFAYGNYAPAYGISFVLAATAVIILVAMILLQPKESRH